VGKPRSNASTKTDCLTLLGPRLHLLATTRQLPPAGGNWLVLGELPPADALALLEKHRPFPTAEERAAAEQIVKRLGGFALAVELLAAWLAAHPGASYAHFAETLGLGEAEPLMRRALAIWENSLGADHPNVATALNNLAALLQATNRLGEAEPLMRRMVEIFLQFTRSTGHRHPHLQAAVSNYAGLLEAMGHTQEQILATLRELAPEFFPP
jgi:hypothetical protein